MRKIKCWAGGVVVVAAVLTAPYTMADTFEWTDPVTGNYILASSWTNTTGVDPGPPGVGDIATFNEAGTYRVNFFGGADSDVLDFQAGDVFFNGQLAAVDYDVLTGQADALLTGGTLTLGESNDAGVTDHPVNLSVGDQLDISGGAALNVLNGSAVTAAQLSLGDTGTLSITNGTFNANGALTMTAGTTLTLDGGALNINAGLDNNANGTLDFRDGTLTVTGGPFDPNDGVAFDGYIIDGPTPAEMPHLVLDAGTTFNLGADIIVGDANRGELTLAEDMTLSTGTTSIGDQAGSTGVATVDGAGSRLFASSTINVGGAGNGTLTIQNGGEASSGTITLFDSHIASVNGSTGTATVDGVGSDWTLGRDLDVGKGGQGTLNVQNGGTVSVDRNLEVGSDSSGEGTLNIQNGGTVASVRGEIGKNNGSTGTATVDGVDSIWTISLVQTIADRGQGTLNIQNGATVSARQATIGQNSTGSGTVNVDGMGSTWTMTIVSPFANLTIGNIGDAELNITGGGTVFSMSTEIAANNFDSTGTVTVDGAGSTWTNSADLFVGGRSNSPIGTGTVTAQNSGLIDVGGTLKIWSPGTVTLNGGSINAGTFDHTDGGTFNFIDGTLTVDTFLGDLTQDGGTIAPGDSPGLTAITGDFTINTGTLEIELGGLTPGTQHDQLNVTGNATLAGTLDVTLINAFAPSLGETFTILTAAAVSGTFGTEVLPALASNLDWSVIYNPADVTLEVITALLLGDANKDGQVTGADLISVQQNFGNVGAVPLQGDANNDGQVTGADLISVQQNFGNVLAPSASQVPEPGMIVILLSVLGAGSLRSARTHAG